MGRKAPIFRRLLLVVPLGVLVGCGATAAVPSESAPIPVETNEATASPSAVASFGVGPQGPTATAFVTSITDGDTVRVELDGVEYPLRYIGIDSPELGIAHADEATAANSALVAGMTVLLESDVSDTDRFGRLLRYVWVEVDGTWLFVNRELVRVGAAVAKAYPPDTKYQSFLEAAEAEAVAASVGIWSATPAPILPLVPPPVTPGPTPAAAGDDCDPSYPGVCIPPYPPDLDCGDVSFRRFQVVPPDPHGFDGNHDGVGCES